MVRARDMAGFMTALEHPLRDGVEALRQIIVGVDPRIVESVKWNAPSYAIGEHFATMSLHRPDRIQLVLHGGAKPRDDLASLRIDDRAGMLSWAAADRANVVFTGREDIIMRRAQLEAVLRQWIAQVIDGRRPAG